MATTTKLNKSLWTNITRLKLLAGPNAPVKFILEKSPFDDFDEEQNTPERDEYSIIGRIFPESDIYKQGSFRIEIKITSKYPTEVPFVRFLTRIYHPNIAEDGTFCHHLLNNSSRWKAGTTLVDVVKTVVKHVDQPDPDYPITYDIGKKYMDNREKFNRTALDMVTKYALPRE